MALGPIVVRKTLATSRAGVWQQLTDPDSRSLWWADLQLSPELGGQISVADTLEGVIDVHVHEQTLGFSWHDSVADNTSNVMILLRPDDEDMQQTVITVIESGFAGHERAAELIAAAETRWITLFDELAQVIGDAEPSDDSDDAGAADDNTEANTVKDVNDAALADDAALVDDSALAEAAGLETATDYDDTVVIDDTVVVDDTVVIEDTVTVEDTVVLDDVFIAEDASVAEDAAVAEMVTGVQESAALNDAQVAPVVLPVAEEAEAIFLPEPDEDYGENDLTGEVPIIIADTGGLPLDAGIIDETAETGGLTEWEKLLRGEES